MKTKNRFFAAASAAIVTSCISFVASAGDYNPTNNPNGNDALADGVKVTMAVDCSRSTEPCDSNFVRTLRFVSQSGHNTDLQLYFRLISCNSSNTRCSYSADSDEIPNNRQKLETMSRRGNRSYWDTIKIVNLSSLTLAMLYLDVKVRYNGGEEPSKWEYSTIAGLPTGSTRMLNGYSTRSLYIWKARACQACRELYYLGAPDEDGYRYPYCSMTSASTNLQRCLDTIANSTDRWTREFLYDLGESGTDGPSGGSRDPKYKWGNDSSMCTETTSWYYKKYGQGDFYDWEHRDSSNDLNSDNFAYKGMDRWTDMAEMFSNKQRLYCYNKPTQKWVRVRLNYNTPILSGWYTSSTTTPRSGDVLVNFYGKGTDPLSSWGGHTMMTVAASSNGQKVYYADGLPVALHSVDLNAKSAPNRWYSDKDQRIYCIGRIPDND